jgi:teichuronic acid exporter
MTALRDVALSGARWTLASRIGLQLVTWPITIVVMRLLHPADYGVFAIAIVVHAFISMFGELGLGVALVQAQTLTSTQVRMAVSIVMVLNLILMAVIFLLAPWVGAQYAQPTVVNVMRALALELLIAGLAVVPFAMLQRSLRYREISQAQIAGGVAGALVTLGAATAGAGVWALVAGNLTNAAIRSARLIAAHGRVELPGAIRLQAVRPMVRMSGHTLAARLLWFWSGQADSLVLGLQLPSSALGAYNVASQIAMLPSGKAMEVVNTVTFPLLCAVQTDAEAAASLVRRLRSLLALYSFGLCWGLAVVASDFVALVLGNKWAAAALPLALLALMSPLRMLAAFQNTVVTALGAPQAATREQLFAALLLPLAVAAGAYHAGLQGAAIAWVLAYPAVFALSLVLTSRVLEQTWVEALRPALAPALAGAAMLGAVVFLRGAATGELSLPVRLACDLAVAALAYLAVLRIAAPSALDQAIELIRELVRVRRA